MCLAPTKGPSACPEQKPSVLRELGVSFNKFFNNKKNAGSCIVLPRLYVNVDGAPHPGQPAHPRGRFGREGLRSHRTSVLVRLRAFPVQRMRALSPQLRNKPGRVPYALLKTSPEQVLRPPSGGGPSSWAHPLTFFPLTMPERITTVDFDPPRSPLFALRACSPRIRELLNSRTAGQPIIGGHLTADR